MVTAGLEKKELGKRRRNSDWWKLVAESVIKPLVSKLGTVFPVVETPAGVLLHKSYMHSLTSSNTMLNKQVGLHMEKKGT